MDQPQWTIRAMMVAVIWVSLGTALAINGYTPSNPHNSHIAARIFSGAFIGNGVGILFQRQFALTIAGAAIATAVSLAVSY
jgi:hypothetical protein